MVLTESVLSGLSPIFSTEVKDVAWRANCLMLHRFYVAYRRAETFDHFYS